MRHLPIQHDTPPYEYAHDCRACDRGTDTPTDGLCSRCVRDRELGRGRWA